MQQATQGFQQMSIGGGPAPGQVHQPAPQPHQQQPQMRLNPLQPVDISMQGQPFHVTDLDQPPPAIILPPNVSNSPSSPE
jgi:protein transport protein SEC24